MSHQIYQEDSSASQLKPERPELVQNPTNATGVTLYHKSVPLYRRAWLRVRYIRRARALYISLCFLSLCIWFILMGIFAKSERDGQIVNSRLANSHTYRQLDSDLIMQGTVRQFDSVKHTLSVSWAMTIAGPNLQTLPTGTSNETSGEIGFYRDQLGVALPLQLVNLTHPNEQGVNEIYPIFGVDNQTAPVVGVLGLHEWDGFSTDIDFDRTEDDSLYQQLSGYPFDRWTAQIVFVANDRDAARRRGLNGSYVVPLADAQLKGVILNWRIGMNATSTCEQVDVPTCELVIKLDARRPNLVRFAVVVALLANWSSTIFIVIMTCELAIMKRTSVIGPNELLAICFTALFALPTVRSILPGVGEFGAMDLIGIIPNVIIITMCTTMVSIVALRKKADEQEEPQPPQVVIHEKQHEKQV